MLSISEARARRLILFTVAAVIGGTLVGYCLYLAREVLTLVYFSAILALGFHPAVRWIEERKLGRRGRHTPRWLAILLFYLALGVLAVTVVQIILQPLANQSRELIEHAPEYVTRAQQWLVKHHLVTRVMSLPQLIERAPSPNSAMTGLLGAVNRVAGVVLAAITALLMSFYFLLDGEEMFKHALRFVPKESRAMWKRIAGDVGAKVGAWLSGQFFLCTLIATTSGIGFGLMGLPYFYVLALACGVGELVPIIGPITAAIPPIIVAATISPKMAVVAAIYLFVQQQIENSVIIPKMMGNRTGVNPIVVIAGIMIGGSLLGVVGALLAVPTAAIIQTFFRQYLELQDLE